MRIKLLNVECEFQVPVVSGQRNVYVPVERRAGKDGINL